MIAVVPLNHCSVCVADGAVLDVNTTVVVAQKIVGPLAVTTGAGLAVTFIALLVSIQFPIFLTTVYVPVPNAAVLVTVNVVAFAFAIAIPFFIHCNDTVDEAATLEVKTTVDVPHNVVLVVVVTTGFAGCVPVTFQA